MDIVQLQIQVLGSGLLALVFGDAFEVKFEGGELDSEASYLFQLIVCWLCKLPSQVGVMGDTLVEMRAGE